MLVNKIVESISDIRYGERMKDMFDLIFKNYKYSNSFFVNKKHLFLGSVVHEFIELILQSSGEFQIATDVVYLFKNKQFFISMNHMLEEEIYNIIDLIDNTQLTGKCTHLRLYESEPISYEVPIKTRLNLLYGFLRFIAQLVADFCVEEGKKEKILILQHKIRLCKLFIGISKICEKNYNLDLSRNLNMFYGIINHIIMEQWS